MLLREYLIRFAGDIEPDAACIMIDDVGNIMAEQSLVKARENWSMCEVITGFSQLDLSGNGHVVVIYVKDFV